MPTTGLTAEQEAEERSILATLAGDDTAAIVTYLRGSHPSAVHAIAAGDGFIHTTPHAAPERLTPVASISISEKARECARRHEELAGAGAAAIRGVLAYLGYSYSGTGGWHMTAYATPDRRLGFVNITHGLAAVTSYTLDAGTIQALTVPGQGDGPQVSVAVAWAAPDPGEAHRAAAPPGWVQLLADMRTEVGPATAPAEAVTARIVTWCLATCYTDHDRDVPPDARPPRPGEPGLTALDRPFDRDWQLPCRDWPAPAEVRAAMDQAGYAALDVITRDLAAQAALPGVVAALDAGGQSRRERLHAAYTAARASFGWLTHANVPPGRPARPAEALDTAMNHAGGGIARALADAEITQLAADCGDTADMPSRYGDLIPLLLRRILTDRLLPAAGLLAEQIDDRRGTGIEAELAVSFTSLPAALGPLVQAAAERILADAVITAHTARKTMTRLYQAQGPVTVDIPLIPALAGEGPDPAPAG